MSMLAIAAAFVIARAMIVRIMDQELIGYWAKVEQSLAGAESEYANGRYSNVANRCYYSCFQAAIVALIREGIRPHKQWGHEFVAGQFVGLLINRRKRYPSELRTVLADAIALRQTADYEPDPVTHIEAARLLRRSRTFVDAIRPPGGDPS